MTNIFIAAALVALSLPFFIRAQGYSCDFNADGKKDVTDLGILLSSWGATGSLHDCSGDGRVDVIDLGILLSGWGGTPQVCTPNQSSPSCPSVSGCAQTCNSLGTGCVDVPEDGCPENTKGPTYPRIGLMSWGGAPAEWYARFDLGQVRHLPINEIRAINPDFIYLPTRDFNAACETIATCPEEWYLHDSKGNRIEVYGPDSLWANLTDVPQGIVNGERLVDALPRFIQQLIQSSGSDGISTDGLYYTLHLNWNPDLWPDIDLDRNGQNDNTEHGLSWVRDHWIKGVDTLMMNIQHMLDGLPKNSNTLLPKYAFLVNTGSGDGGFAGSSGYAAINGFLNEHNGPSFGPPSPPSAGRQPYIFLDNVTPSGPWISPSQNNFRSMRFGLTRSMLEGNYFNFQDLSPGGDNHYWDRYYDEFDLDVGYPTSELQEIPGKSGVWTRFFDGGAAISNINRSSVAVSDGDIHGLNGYAGPYWRFQGGQDPGMNNGQQFISVALQGFTDSYGGGISGDGIVLVKNPLTVVSDIIIDNADSGTSPGSSPAQLSGGWQEDCVDSSYTLRCAGWFDSWGASFINDSGATAAFTPTIGVAGNYEVYEWHGNVTNACTSVPIIINGQNSSPVNQSTNSGKWNSLGTFYFSSGIGGYVKLISPGGCTVQADAIKFVYHGS